MSSLFENFFDPEVLALAWPGVVRGLAVTTRLAGAVIVTGTLSGLVLAVVRSFRVRVVNFFLVAFVDAFRAVPPLVVLVVIYFALPYVDVQLSGFACAWLGLSLVLAAFAEEIFWASILSVDRGQWEAARSTGLSFLQALGFVVLPQAVRLAIPPLTNRAIAIGKGTALASVLAVPEILNEASNVQAQVANPSPLTLAALAYLVLFAPLVILSRWVETRFEWKH